jgi:hypothetical protein
MSSRTFGHAVTLTSGVAACVLLVAAVAIAATVTTKSNTAALPGDATTHPVTVTCPVGAKSVGGGIRLSDAINDYAQGSYPRGKRVWTAAGRNDNPPDTEVTAFARCLRGAPMSSITETAPVPADGSSHEAVARCPRGTLVAGGGIKIADDDTLETAGSYPSSPRAWTAVARPTGTPGEVTAFARCLRGKNLIQRSQDLNMPSDAQTHEVTARCPARTKLTGGGLELSEPNGNYLQGSYPEGRRGWTAAGYDGGLLTAHAVCLKRG